jgi:hypothetical protein
VITEAMGPEVFEELWEPLENSGNQKGDMKQVTYSGQIY